MADQSEFLPLPKGFATKAIHNFQEPDQWDALPVVAPLVESTTFKQFAPAEFKKYEYGRSGNPSREILENVLASLENTKYGLCFASGLGATTALCGILQQGDHLICGDDVYGGTNRLLNKVFVKFGLEISLVEALDLDAVEKAIKKNTKLIWVETPTNPTMKVVDIQAVSDIAKKHNLILVVDNTFLTPYFQRPVEFGADIIVHSISKYLNGHSDVIMGAITTNNKELYDKMKFNQNAMGIVPSPRDCHIVIRSLKTLTVRMQQHMKNGFEIAKFLESHPKVEKVLHPGLPSHPQQELTKRQTSGHSGMVSFYLKGEIKESRKFLSALKVFALAESLGGYESLAELPSVMTHASVPEEQRKLLNISDNLIRLSVGLEDAEDLIADLQQALEQI